MKAYTVIGTQADGLNICMTVDAHDASAAAAKVVREVMSARHWENDDGSDIAIGIVAEGEPECVLLSDYAKSGREILEEAGCRNLVYANF